jgi:protein-disulfide isomerase
MTRFLPMLVAALLIVGGGVFYMSQNNGLPPGVSIAEAQDASADVEAAPDMALGDENAPVILIEYASYTCPHCANFHANVFKQLKADYIDTGKVRFIHREVFFDRYGLWAAMIARCGGELRYFGLNDLIYSNQAEWIGSGEPQEVLGGLRRLGRMAGMSDDQMNSCLEDNDLAMSLVKAYQTNAEADGINSTPTLVINGEKYSNMGYAELTAILDGLLAQQ